MADPWCGKCGHSLQNQPHSVHCTKCGAKATTTEPASTREVLNYSQFKSKKAGERCADVKRMRKIALVHIIIYGGPSLSRKNKFPHANLNSFHANLNSFHANLIFFTPI